MGRIRLATLRALRHPMTHGNKTPLRVRACPRPLGTRIGNQAAGARSGTGGHCLFGCAGGNAGHPHLHRWSAGGCCPASERYFARCAGQKIPMPLWWRITIQVAIPAPVRRTERQPRRSARCCGPWACVWPTMLFWPGMSGSVFEIWVCYNRA